MKKYTDLSEQEKEALEEKFFLTEEKDEIFIDRYGRPYVKKDGLLYFSMRGNYTKYSIKNK
jgi:hypothetical protein